MVAAYNLTYFRRAAGLTQEQFGERLGGWSAASVSAAERSWDGKRISKFDADELVSIALALGIPVIALLLPPANAGTAVRYVLDTEPGQPDMLGLLPRLVLGVGGDTDELAPFQDRMMAIGASNYLDPASNEAMKIIDLAGAAAEQLTGDARARAESLEHGAEEGHRIAMDSLVQSREELERRIDDLRAFEREYRSNLLAYMEAQVRELRAGVADPHPSTSEGGAQ
jgi:transcriptional regulator with XRE-family HTH domain